MADRKFSPAILPVLFGFFIMGFCDIVGITSDYVQKTFAWSDSMTGFVPSLVFIWFLFLGIPVGNCMNRWGRKNTVLLSLGITIVGMFLPMIVYNSVTCMLAYVMLGIGNAILQVSLNPLLSNVVTDSRLLTSSLTVGQVVKAVSSFCGPFIASFAAGVLGNWQYLFPIFAAITLLSALWLMSVRIPEEASEKNSSSMGAAFSLLGDRTILLLFLGIFFVVGVDVGTNTVAPKLLIERCGFGVEQAGYGSSVYFVCRTVGALIGSILLVRISDVAYFRVNMLAALASAVALFFAQGTVAILVLVGLIGFFCSSIFSVIYSSALKKRPEKANEISGLMIMGVFGGAVIPPLMGVMADTLQSQVGSLLVIAASMLDLVGCSLWLGRARR